jgi:REP element-mobilizing transposase RayT
MHWDAQNPPLAYLLTFRTYGTWNHGDTRGSVGRKFFNKYKAPKMKRSEKLVATEQSNQKSASFVLVDVSRKVVGEAIAEVCEHREYLLHGLNVRTNHVHAVVSHDGPPEKITEAFKSYSTRALRALGLIGRETKVWARHCSTRYLWDEVQMDEAIKYVLYFQGDEFPSFDEVSER